MKELMTNDSSIMIYKDRYEFNNEGILGTLERVAKHVSNTDEESTEYLNVMNSGFFLPAGRTITNSAIGKDLTLNNCFNANHIPDSIDGIFDYVKLGAKTHQKGGGIGYDYSKIRPKGSPTSNEAVASGVVSFMEVADAQTKTILQGGRRGANMGALNIYHPDIYNFLSAKSYDEGKLTQFNLSIMIDNDFMNAVEKNKSVFLRYPVYDEDSNIIKDSSKWTQSKEINARELWDVIIKKAYDTGEYGVLYYDNMNVDNPTYYLENIVTTNPCAEYLSGVLKRTFTDKLSISQEDYKGACNLGSIHLHRFVDNPFSTSTSINYDELKNVIYTSVKMLDSIIDKNIFPDASYENYQKNMRTIGLGVTGLHNAISMFGYQYGDDDSVNFTNNIIEFIFKNAYLASIELAKEKGEFVFLDRHKYVQNKYLEKHNTNGEWQDVIDGIKEHGIRNARICSVAPVGTMSLTLGDNCSSGIEPTFMNEVTRNVKIGGQSEDDIKQIKVKDYAFKKWQELNPDKTERDYPYKTAMELSVDDHLAILKVIAFHTDMSVSKTVNVPTEYSFEDTKELYMDAWKNGIKGITIFRPNELRKGIFNVDEDNGDSLTETKLEWGTVIQSSDDLIGRKRKINTGCGSLHIHAFFDPITGDMMEVFFSKGGSGGCFGYAGGLSRMISLALRTGSPINTIVDQLKSVQGCPSYVIRTKIHGDTGKGNNCSGAIGFVLKDMQNDVMNELHDHEDYFEERSNTPSGTVQIEIKNEVIKQSAYSICPECKEEAYTNADGCGSCTSCGYSKCG